MDLENMSDQDLRIKLASLGHNIGPISCTTRNLYEKILLKLMDPDEGEGKVASPREPATPVLKGKLKRAASENDKENISDATFNVPAEKKKKVEFTSNPVQDLPLTPVKHTDTAPSETAPCGIPRPGIPRPLTGIALATVPSLRRSTIERTALSRKLAEEKTTGSVKKGLRPPGLRTTESSASLKQKLDMAAKAEMSGRAEKFKPAPEPKEKFRPAPEPKEKFKPEPKAEPSPRGAMKTVFLAVTKTTSNTTPGYMRATTSTKRKDPVPASSASKKPDLNTTRGGRLGNKSMRRSIRLAARRSFRRVGQPTPVRRDIIPKVGTSTIRKAKDTPSSTIRKAKDTPSSSKSAGSSGAGKTGAGAGKKKRAAWDVKGRLEDVTALYTDLKEEKALVDDQLADLELDVDVKTGELGMLRTECASLKDDLLNTKDALSETQKRATEQQFRLEETVLERNEKVSSYERIKRERDEVEEDFLRTKGRLRESDLKADDLERDIRRANNAKEEVQDNLKRSKKREEELEASIQELKTEISQHTDTIRCRDSRISELESTLEKERGEKGDVHNILRRKEQQIEQLDAKIAELESTIKELKRTVESRDKKVDELECTLNKQQRTHRDVNRVLEDRESQVCDLDRKLATALERVHAGESLRRKLHNTIQELKGNIRVYCRVRPFLQHEVTSGQPLHEIPQIDFTKDNSGLSVAAPQGEKLGRRGEMLNHEFAFDHVFGPRHSQEDTFAEVSGLVQSALDGYNVCIFAYGQTGSGKTHTMQGPIDPASPLRGVIPRSMEQVFKTGDELREQGWSYTFTASFIEIYNEVLLDLIGGSSEKIEIKLVNEKSREVEVTNVRSVAVQNTYDVHELLLKANKNRTVAATKCNERSSRSHSVFRLKIEGKNIKNGTVCAGNLNLVDLAGSERVGHSGSTGQRLKEAQAINTSLSELGNVMMALQEKKSHIPYRNSKLTYLLCNSLGGNSKTLMFVNVSPLDKHTPESVNSLRFASKVNKVDLGTAKKNK